MTIGCDSKIWSKYRADYQVFCEQELEHRYKGANRFCRILLVQGLWAVTVYRLGTWVYSFQSPFTIPIRAIYVLVSKISEILTGIMLPASVDAGAGLYIAHFGGVIINGAVKLGANLDRPRVVLGTKGAGRGSGVPRVGSNVYISAGAKVLGNIVIGDNVIIGANAVVTKDVPNDVIVVGVPARIIGPYIHGLKDS